MTQEERRRYLIGYLAEENKSPGPLNLPPGEQEQKRLLRSLMNLRPPRPADEEFLRIQDAYLLNERSRKPVTSLSDLMPAENGIYLWQGDITALAVDAIVNAANSTLLGCFVPCHGCIDNAIHSAAGIQLRLSCRELMQGQGHEEPPGRARLTPAFCLPSRFVIHTVGPIVQGSPTQRDCALLASCYQSCLTLAREKGLKSVAFCCISTGEFHFPNEAAAEIAVHTVRSFQKNSSCKPEVVFNVYKDLDWKIYRKLLRSDGTAQTGL